MWSLSTGQKRYAITRRGADDKPIFDRRAKPSNHGIGNLVNPSGLSRRDFTIACWTHIERVLAGDTLVRSADHAWLDLPDLRLYVARYPGCLHEQRTAGTPLPDEGLNVVRAFPGARPYDRFLIANRSLHRGGPIIARYTPDTSEWLGLDWRDAHTGESVRITTRSVFDTEIEDVPPADPRDDRQLVGVRTLRAYLWRYAANVEALTLDASGAECRPQTRGVITPQAIRIVARRCTGRELGRIPERQAGLRPDEGRRVTYRDDPELLRNALQVLPRSDDDLRALSLHPRTVRYARAGRPLRDTATLRIIDAAHALVADSRRSDKPSAAITLALAAQEQTPALRCRRPGCETTVCGRRLWCPTHAQASSRVKARWRRDAATAS